MNPAPARLDHLRSVIDLDPGPYSRFRRLPSPDFVPGPDFVLGLAPALALDLDLSPIERE